MKEKGLANFFEQYLEKQPLFKDKTVLQANYTPDIITHRDEQLKLLANILAPVLRNNKPSNVFLYGKTGSGKTLSIKYTTTQLETIAKQRNIPLKVIYLNCKLKKLADTEYRLVTQILREYGKEIPTTGLPTAEVYHYFTNILEKDPHNLILILDEIDQLIGKAGDELLYNLTRINSELEKTQVTIIGISNDINFTDKLEPRVRSSLSQEELIFPPYNAIQIQDILRERAKLAFHTEGLEEGMIEKCAAYAAREHGDARRALDLLRVAGEIAERDNQQKLTIDALDKAEQKIERDRLLDMVKSQPKQYQLALYAILALCHDGKGVYTGEIYSLYEKYCTQTGLRPLTQRRISDVISELDMFGMINAAIISKGRYGRTREIRIDITQDILAKITTFLSEELSIPWNSQ